MSIEEKLLKTRFVIDSGRPHITLDTEHCKECLDELCLVVCPTQCYKKDQTKIQFTWENCIECGSCRVVCHLGSITWEYPRGGFGVCYRYG